MQPNTGIAVAIVVALGLAGIWDIIALSSGGKMATVSSVLTGWARDLPIFAVSIGVLIGHLFWPADPKV